MRTALPRGLVLLVGLLSAAAPAVDWSATNRPQNVAGAATSGEQALISRMVGAWNVRASLWLGPDAKPILQSAVATRRLIGDALLEEVMTPAPGSYGPRFTRVAFLGYNAVNSNYEYLSWDTRAPQMMYQVSRAAGMPGETQASRVIWFHLVDNFVVPQWGDVRNVAFRHRLMIDPADDRQVVRLHWTRLSGEPNKEFLAGEYVYTRQQ
jgi:hypothetical protein